MIDSVDQVLRRSGRGWRVVTDDPVLRPFLARGGDYTFVAADAEILDEPNSGNLIAWRPQGDAIVLTHADTDRGPACEIDRAVLVEVVARLVGARKRTAGVVVRTRPAQPGSVRARAARRARG